MKVLQTLILLCVAGVMFSQDYQRLYRLDMDYSLEVIDATNDDSGSTYVLSRVVAPSDSTISLQLAKHNLKGDRDWHTDIVLDEEYIIQRFGDIQTVGMDTFMISFYALKDTVYHQGLLSMTRGGEYNWSYTHTSIPDDTNVGRPVELAVGDTSVVMATCKLDSTESFSLWNIDFDGQPLGPEYNYVLSDSIQVDSLSRTFNSSFSEVGYSTFDTTLVVSGKMFDDTTSLFVAKLDTALNQVWARSYAMPMMDEGQVYEQLITSNGDIILVGTARPDFTRGFVISLDSLGNINWHSTVFNGDPAAFGSYCFTATLGLNDEIVIGGSYLENFVFQRPYLVAFDQTGTKLWEKQYNRSGIDHLNTMNGILETYEYLTIREQGSVIAMPDGGYQFSLTQLDDFGDLTRNGLLIKTDNQGNSFRVEGEVSTCDEDINMVSGSTVITTDSLVLIRSEIDSTVAVLNAIEDVVTSYTTPVVGTENIIQCPDSIDLLLDVTLQDAVSYEWNTGDTTATLQIFDEEQYSVTITFDTDICFQLCDTFMATTYGPVDGLISLQEDNWCEDRTFLLEAFATGGDGEYTYLWGNGDMTSQTIGSAVDTDYLVTITDGCGQDTVISAFIPLSNFEQPDNADIIIDCADNMYELTVITDGDFIDESSIVWSTGDTATTTIIVADEGLYSVTLTDDCLYEITASIDNTDITQMSLGYDDMEYCSSGVIFVSANFGPPGFFNVDNIQWSTGAVDDGSQVITVTEHPMTYSATITDNCGNTFVDEVNVPDLSQEPEVLMLNAICNEMGLQYCITNQQGQITLSSAVWTDAIGNTLDIGSQCITLSEPQDVTVVALDDCQNEVTATLTAAEVMEATMSSIAIDQDPDICDEPQEFILTLTDISPGVDLSTVLWSTSETSTSITVDQAGTYTVTAQDQCGFDVNAEVTITEDDFYVLPTLTITKECTEFQTTITAMAFGDVKWDNGYFWTNSIFASNPNLPSQTVDDPGTYEVYVLGNCPGDTIRTTITLNGGDFSPCACIEWPNFMTFDPNAEAEDSRFFGPAVNCPELITDYKLYVFNAFGNQLFFTDEPDNLWKGTGDKGDPMPSGIYMYYASYIIDGVEEEASGEITLAR